MVLECCWHDLFAKAQLIPTYIDDVHVNSSSFLLAFLPPYPSENYQSNPFFQPYELVDDVSTEERRGYALDMLRYMRISGFDLVSSGSKNNSLAEVSAHTCIYIYIHTYVHVCIV